MRYALPYLYNSGHDARTGNEARTEYNGLHITHEETREKKRSKSAEKKKKKSKKKKSKEKKRGRDEMETKRG